MAVKISKELLKGKSLYISWKRYPITYLKFKLKRFIKEFLRKRELSRVIEHKKLISRRKDVRISTGEGLNEASLMSHSTHFQENNWVFINDFFSASSHNTLCQNFPHSVFFQTASTGEKYYDFAKDSLYLVPDGPEQLSTEFFNIHPELQKLYSFLSSDDMNDKVRKLTGAGQVKLYSVLASRASEGSFLAPHIDSIFIGNEDSDLSCINVIYFLLAGGAEPAHCGGTGIYKDNAFNEPMCIPSSMLNSALIYNSTQDFYHGFDTMSPGSFRWAITFQYHIN